MPPYAAQVPAARTAHAFGARRSIQSQVGIGWPVFASTPKPAQQLPWLVALFPESDKAKPLLKATLQAQAQAETQLASQPQETQQR